MTKATYERRQRLIAEGRCPRCGREVEPAPELLEALYDSLRAWEDEEDSVQAEHRTLIVRLRQVIAKATGTDL